LIPLSCSGNPAYHLPDLAFESQNRFHQYNEIARKEV
jgi:hypothetical protein